MKQKLQELQYRIQRLVEKCGHNDEMFREEISEMRKDIVNFHGEMVLLVNFSNINYTGESVTKFFFFLNEIFKI